MSQNVLYPPPVGSPVEFDARVDQQGKSKPSGSLLIGKLIVTIGAALGVIAVLASAWLGAPPTTEDPLEIGTVIVVMDVSLSMEAKDLPQSRFEATQAAAKQFAESLPAEVKVGLVIYAAMATVVVEPTVDRMAFASAIDGLHLAQSTAIGDAIYTALEVIDDSGETGPAAIVLIGDGESNIGRGSLDAAKQAGQAGVPIYTIAVGTSAGAIFDDRESPIPVPVNRVELLDIARASGGQSYAAESSDQ
ncbi:MAG: VWA domain-containing protein, partial [Propionibacteriaceae bacterium]|nr:VWA domain-containing protein [Propionibacteriaceae bacterium]